MINCHKLVTMVGPPFLIIPKSEWYRISRQGGPLEKPVDDKQKYLKEITEQSQKWINTWPDSLAIQLDKIEKDKKKHIKGNIELIKEYKKVSRKVKHENTTKAIKKAKKLIFEDSNYGRKLQSAFLESRALEERDAQIKFKKEIQKKAAEFEQQNTFVTGAFNNLHGNDIERQKKDKQKMLECVEANKQILLLKKEKELEEKLIENKCATEAEKLMEQVIEIEKEEKKDIKRCEKEEFEQYETDSKKLAKIKEDEQKVTDAIIEAHKNEQDRITSRTRAVLKQVYQGRADTKRSKDLYKKVKNMQIDAIKRYDDFIDKGVKISDERNSRKEIADKLEEKQISSKRCLISQRNKIIGEEIAVAQKYKNKCACDKQTLIMDLNGKSAKTKITSVSSTRNLKDKRESISDNKDKLKFMAPRNILTEELRLREKVPSPWTSTATVHAQFARQADDLLQEVQHKYFARKVVDEYRKLNCLDDATLPVPNY